MTKNPTQASAMTSKDATTLPCAALEITGLSFGYPGAKRETVRVGTLSIAAGEQVLLTGGSGSGKSTLLNLVAGLLEPTAGSVRVDGRDIHRLRGPARDAFRGRTIGMIFQTFNLLPGFSARENVMLAMMLSGAGRGEQHDRASALLGSLGIDRPDADVARLSVGQQQRVAVARAVACRPALVLADEPTASLDPENANSAIGLIQETCRQSGAALVCVSHDPSMRERFARVESMAELSASMAGMASTASTGSHA